MKRYLHTALLAAEAALRVHRLHARRIHADSAREKSRSDFVTEADLEAQRAVHGVIQERHPDHLFLGEEATGEEGASTGPALGPEGLPGGTGLTWVVDPIDGTTNYLHGHPEHAVSIALVEGEHPVVGVVAATATGERWWAIEGEGAWKSGRPISVSTVDRVTRALVGTGFPFRAIDRLDEYQAQFSRVLRACAGIRRQGSAAIDFCRLAEGTYDAFWEIELSPWDVAAGILIVREAGGIVTRVDGSPAGIGRGSFAAANGPGLHGALIGLLRGG